MSASPLPTRTLPLLLGLAPALLWGCQFGEYDQFGGTGERDEDRTSPGVGGGGGDDGGDDDGGDDDTTSGGETAVTATASLDKLGVEVVDGVAYAAAETTITLVVSGLEEPITIDSPLQLDLYHEDDASVQLSVDVHADATWSITADGTHAETYRTEAGLDGNAWYAYCDQSFYGQVTVTWGEALGTVAVTSAIPMECVVTDTQ